MEQNSIVLYQTEDGQTQIDVRLENDTVWLSVEQMSCAFRQRRIKCQKARSKCFS